LIACDHPSIWKFLDFVQQEQQYSERTYAMICGGKGKLADAKVDEIDERLKRVISLFARLPWDDYLNGVASIR